MNEITLVVSLYDCVRIVGDIECEEDDTDTGDDFLVSLLFFWILENIDNLEKNNKNECSEECIAEMAEVIAKKSGESSNENHDDEDACDLEGYGLNDIGGYLTEAGEEGARQEGEEEKEEEPGEYAEGCEDEEDTYDDKEEDIEEEVGLDMRVEGVVLAENKESDVEHE